MGPYKPANPPAQIERADEFYEAYANNVFYESSSWDLKLLFGQLDQAGGKVGVILHSAITLPWPQVQLMVYWLRGQIEAHELANGKIHISPRLLPAELPPVTDELREQDPNADATYEIFNRLRKELISHTKQE